MKKKKSRINRGDLLRALLTETTPYELPLIINNSGFYRQLKNENVNRSVHGLLDIVEAKRTVPLSYKIVKDERSLRSLACPHPAAQLNICSLYTSYDSLMLFLCNKSQFSLRYPSKTASYYYKGEALGGVKGRDKYTLAEADDSLGEIEQDHSSSYFAYKKYNLLYKFYESFEYQNLEKRFTHLLRFDISKCFDSIYTHTLAWAVKNKQYAKINDGFSFENNFDKVISNSNHGETNGIIIGPEVCRIFAEIILQRIDSDAASKLRGIVDSDQFTVRRYVDDYFVFSSHPDISRTIFEIFKSELERHKLHVNESKTEEFNAPFITSISVAKSEMSSRLNDILGSLTGLQSEALDKRVLKAIRGHHALSHKLIKSTKEVLHSCQVGFHSIAGHALTIVNKHITELLSISVTEENENSFASIMFALLEYSFFISSMAPRVRSIYLTTKSCVLAINLCAQLSYDLDNNIRKKIHDECLSLIEKICRSQQYEKTNSVEFSNLLVCISLLGEDYKLEEGTIQKIIGSFLPKDPTELLGYFELTSLLFYIRDDISYKNLHTELKQLILDKVVSLDPAIYSETAHLLLDSLSCPYLHLDFKEELLAVAYSHRDIIKDTSELRRIAKELGKDEWFCVWSGDDKIFELLEKKTLKNLY